MTVARKCLQADRRKWNHEGAAPPGSGAHRGAPAWTGVAVAASLALASACTDGSFTAPALDASIEASPSPIPGPSTALYSSIPASTAFTYSPLPLQRANDVNDAGVVVGDIGGNNVAAYWTQPSGLVVLGQVQTGSTACCSALVDLNEASVAAGTSTLGGGISLTQWTLGGAYVDLPTSMGRNEVDSSSAATAIASGSIIIHK